MCGVGVLHSYISVFGVPLGDRCCDSFPKLKFSLFKRVGLKGVGLGPRVRVSILAHVDRRATCSGCAVGLHGLHSSVLCIIRALKTWIKAVPGRSCYAGLPGVSSCRIVLPTTLPPTAYMTPHVSDAY